MNDNKPSKYLNYLPVVYRDNPFLDQFLALFEAPLRELEGKIADIPAYFNPDSFVPGRVPALFDNDVVRNDEARKEFLDWLAGWVALTLRQDWSEASQRLLIKKIATIYPKRGTRAGVEKLIRIYVDPEAELDEGGTKQVLDTFNNLTVGNVETQINNQSERLIAVKRPTQGAGNIPLPTTVPLAQLSPVVLRDWVSQPTLEVTALKQGLALRVEDGAKPNTFKLTVIAAEPFVSIQEQLLPFQVGIPGHSEVGEHTFVGGGMPHHFIVKIDFAVWKPDYQGFKRLTVIDIVDLEKPAHTYYDLEVLIPTLQVGIRSHVGMDTVLGNKNI